MEFEKYDFHIHTSLCDGHNTPEEMVEAAISSGMKAIGFSGHMDPPCGVSLDIGNYIKEIRNLKDRYEGKIDIFLGGEVDCLFDLSKLPELEYVIGSTHSLRMKDGREFSVDDTPEILQNFCREYFGGDYYKLTKAYYETEAHIADRIKPDFIGHFDVVTRFNDELHFVDEDDPRYLNSALETMEHLVKKGIPFEINCGAVNRNRKKEFYPCKRLLGELFNMGGRIVISSDAHEKSKICGAFKAAAETALECGFKYTYVLCRDSSGGINMKEISLEEPAVRL